MAKCKNCKELTVKIETCVGVEVPFDWCDKKQDNPFRNKERDCPYFKPKTNADRIRSMTDEELTEFLYDTATVNECCICGFKEGWRCTKKENETCHDGVLRWLKSEVGCE